MEKCDQLQVKVPEPMTMSLEEGDVLRISSWQSLPSLSPEQLHALHGRTIAALKSAGLSDVRVPRRDRAADFASIHNKKAAGALLRHAPNSVHTTRYTGPAAASARMTVLLAASPSVDPSPRTAIATTRIPTRRVRTSESDDSPNPATPPRLPSKRTRITPDSPIPFIPPTMAGGRLSVATQRKVARALLSANEAANQASARRLLGL